MPTIVNFILCFSQSPVTGRFLICKYKHDKLINIFNYLRIIFIHVMVLSFFLTFIYISREIDEKNSFLPTGGSIFCSQNSREFWRVPLEVLSTFLVYTQLVQVPYLITLWGFGPLHIKLLSFSRLIEEEDTSNTSSGELNTSSG